MSLCRKCRKSFWQVYNLGTGQGVSVLELIKTFERVTGTTIPYKISERREGDICVMYANAELAYQELGWKSKYTLEEMCKFALFSSSLLGDLRLLFSGKDFWRWQTMNPNGYRIVAKITNGHH